MTERTARDVLIELANERTGGRRRLTANDSIQIEREGLSQNTLDTIDAIALSFRERVVRQSIEEATEIESERRMRREWHAMWTPVDNRPIPLRWYSHHDSPRNEFILGLQDESAHITCEQRIAEELLRRGRSNEVGRAAEWLGDQVLVHLREAGIPPERIELYRQFIGEHVRGGFLWGQWRRSRDEVSLCTCDLCENERRRDTRQAPVINRQDQWRRLEYLGDPRPEQEADNEANSRARSLLLSCLSPFQRQRFIAEEWFIVVAKSGRRYRIEKGYNFNIAVLDKSGKNTIGHLCAGPSENVPVYDSMLAQKLWLENDEEGFLKVANRDGLIDELINYGGARQWVNRR